MDAGRDDKRQGAGGRQPTRSRFDSGKIGPCHPILKIGWGLGAGLQMPRGILLPNLNLA